MDGSIISFCFMQSYHYLARYFMEGLLVSACRLRDRRQCANVKLLELMEDFEGLVSMC